MHNYCKQFILGAMLYTNYAWANAVDQYTITCPAIQSCKPSDGPKKNQVFAKLNQQAYDCFQSMGQTDLANQAFTAKTKCQAIYGATTATVGTDNQAISVMSISKN